MCPPQSRNSVRQDREAAALRLLLQSAPAVIQDMAAHAAEAVAVCYLAEARSGMSGEYFPTIKAFATVCQTAKLSERPEGHSFCAWSLCTFRQCGGWVVRMDGG